MIPWPPGQASGRCEEEVPLLSSLPVSNYRRWSQQTVHSFSSTTFCCKIREDNNNFWGHSYASWSVTNSTSLLPWIVWKTRRWWNITLGQEGGDTLSLRCPLRLSVTPAQGRGCTDHVSHRFRVLHFLQYNMHVWNTFGILLSKQRNYQCTF